MRLPITISVSLTVLLTACSLDEGRTLDEYRLDFNILADGGALADGLTLKGPNAGGKAGVDDVASDGGVQDSGAADSSVKDSGVKDSGAKDTATTDTAKPDTTKPDIPPIDTSSMVDGCSGPDGLAYTINITNTTSDRSLTIGWNDIDCNEKILGKIKPGKSANLGTKLNRWVFVRIEPDNDEIRSFRVTTTTSPKMLVP